MSKYYKICVFCAAVLSALPAFVFFTARGGVSRTINSGSGYAVLTIDDSQDAFVTTEMLEEKRIKGVISASNQTALLNVFSGIESVSLNDYYRRIEKFDPRNDGYAEKALSIFESGGKKRIYIPAREVPASGIEGIAGELGFASYAPISPAIIIIFIISYAAMLLYVRHYARTKSDNYLFFYALSFIPSFAIIAVYGVGGFAASAVLAAFFRILRAPAYRVFTGMRYFGNGSFMNLLRREMPPEAQKLIVFPVIYILIAIVSSLPAVAATAAPVFFLLSFVSVAHAEAARGRLREHTRFVFVPIRSSSYGVRKFPTVPLPFIAAAVIAVPLAFALPSNVIKSAPPRLSNISGLSLTKNDFIRHVDFQRKFAYKRLGSAEDGSEGNIPYEHYSAGRDGLIESVSKEPLELSFPDSAYFTESPEWTIEPLVYFLTRGASSVGGHARGGTPLSDIAAILLSLTLYIPFIVTRRIKPRTVRES